MDDLNVSNDGPWTLGVKIGLPFALLGLIILLVATVIFFKIAFGKQQDAYALFSNRGALFCGVGGIVAILLYIGGMFWSYYPLDSSYHQYRPVTGTVAQVSNRYIITNDGQGNSSGGQKYVVVFKGSAQQFGINDTRAALVKAGDNITINCIRYFEYGSTDGYDCKWGGKN